MSIKVIKYSTCLGKTHLWKSISKLKVEKEISLLTPPVLDGKSTVESQLLLKEIIICKLYKITTRKNVKIQLIWVLTELGWVCLPKEISVELRMQPFLRTDSKKTHELRGRRLGVPNYKWFQSIPEANKNGTKQKWLKCKISCQDNSL